MPGFYQLADDAPLNSQLLSCFKHIELTATLPFIILVYSNVISVPDSTDSCFIPRVPFCCRYLKSVGTRAIKRSAICRASERMISSKYPSW